MFRVEKAFNVNGRSTLAPERLSHRKYPRPSHLTHFDAMADDIRVFQYGPSVKDSGKAPAGEHLLQLGGDLFGREFFGMEKARRQDMNMAVPETSRYSLAVAVNHRRVARNFDRRGWPNGENAARTYNDRTVFDRRISGRRVDSGMNQGEVRTRTKYPAGERPNKKYCEGIPNSHAGNIRQAMRDHSAPR